MADGTISKIQLPDNTIYDVVDNTSGYITGFTETDPIFSASAAHGITLTDISNWNGKQAALVSGTNIKTINDTSLLGSGNISITDNKVAQGVSTSNSPQPILFRNNVGTSASDSTEGARYVTSVTITPKTGDISATKFNGYTLAGACAKAVDTSISANSSSVNLPTSSAVASFVEGKGYITGYTETDPTVPSWAKASSKPSYTFAEIGSKPTSLSGYGITDAKIENGMITLGSNTIIPLTSFIETDPVFTASAAHGITSTDITNWNGKQAALVSGTNIKTINGDSILGSGDLTVTRGTQVQLVRWS